MASPRPAGFAEASLDGVVVDIGFDGEKHVIRHRFDHHELVCEPLGAAPSGFRTPYIAARLDHGDVVVHFAKTSPHPPEIVTLVLPADGTSALAACHRIDHGRASPRHNLTVLRGSTTGAFSFADLTAFPLCTPPTAELRLIYTGATTLANAEFTRAGHLRAWRMSSGSGTAVSAPASGRLLAITSDTAVLPWVAKHRAGTLVLDRVCRTFWGVDATSTALHMAESDIVTGNIDAWAHATTW